MKSLLEFMEVHACIDELFEKHRDRVVELRFAAALEALEAFEHELLRHMQDQEEVILPLYEARVGAVPGGSPELFRLEHRNLVRNLATIKQALQALVADPSAGPREAHRFLAKGHLFFQLLEHHSQREKNILYPRLDAALSEEERQMILRNCGLCQGRALS